MPNEPSPTSPMAPRGAHAALAMVLLAAAALRLGGLGQESLWADEFYTLTHAGEPTLALACRSALAAAAPLPYHVLQHYFCRVFGLSDVMLRLPAALYGIAALGCAWACMRVLTAGSGRMAAWPPVLAATVLTLAPMHVWYSQEARPYSLLVLMIFTALLALLRGLAAIETDGDNAGGAQRRGAWWLAAAAVLAGLASEVHSHGIFVWGLTALMLSAALFRTGRRTRGALVAALVLLIAGVVHPLWDIVQRLGPKSIYQDFLPARYGPEIFFHVLRAQVLGPHWSPWPPVVQWLGLVIGAALLVRGGRRLVKAHAANPLLGWVIPLGWLCTVAAPTLISLVRPIIWYGQRYLIIGLPFTVLLLAANALPAPGPTQRGQCGRYLCIVAAAVLALLQAGYFVPYYRYRQKHVWDVAAEQLRERLGPGDQVYALPGRNAGLLQHYLGPQPAVGGLLFDENEVRHALAADLPGTIYVVGYTPMQTDADWLVQQGSARKWGVGILETHQPGQELYINSFALPDK